jgi:hypothetical protein
MSGSSDTTAGRRERLAAIAERDLTVSPSAASERLAAMGPERRLTAYEGGRLTSSELYLWAALWPDEVPLLNGELPWIAATAADLD